jgi:hypothetical protein
MKTVLSHANLIDCVEPKVRPDCAVLIEDGRIHAILPSGEAGSAGDAQMIDLKGGFLMPGLWDVHIHPDYLSLDEMPLADQVTPVRPPARGRAYRIPQPQHFTDPIDAGRPSRPPSVQHHGAFCIDGAAGPGQDRRGCDPVRRARLQRLRVCRESQGVGGRSVGVPWSGHCSLRGRH